MATEIYFHRFAVDGIQTLYLEHMPPGATTISGSNCCHGNLVAMATEKYFYNLWYLKEYELRAWETYSFLGNFIKWFTGQY